LGVLEIIEITKDEKGFRATVKDLEKTGLYPEGKGGQLGDRGRIGNVEIILVTEECIYLSEEIPTGKYNFLIDEERREDIRIQHTSEHLFAAFAYRDFNLKTNGFRMSEDYTTIDLDSNSISEKVIENLENKVNNAIKEGIKVIEHIHSPEEVVKFKDIRKGISEKVTGDIRIIEIPDIDLNACGGFHVQNTSEIQLFKILKWEKVKSDYTRFYFVAGGRALKDYSSKNKIIRELNKTFSCQDQEILEMIKKFTEDKKKLEGTIKYLSGEYSSLLAKSLEENAIHLQGKDIILYEGDETIISNLTKFIDPTKYLYIGIGKESITIFTQCINCKDLVIFLMGQNPNLKGGGSPTRANIKGTLNKQNILEALNEFFTK
jgi:alanyl-tRNA synthetase